MGAHSADLTDTGAWKQDPIGAARRGENPTVIATMPSGFVAIGDTQFLPGYCLLLADAEADHLTDLPRAERAQFLADMSLLGEALVAVCGAWDPAFARINYEILGNTWRHLHAHLIPRYSWEPPEFREGPVWRYPDERRSDPAHTLSPEHDRLAEAIRRELDRLMSDPD